MPSKSSTVLVVDDDPALRQFVQHTLERAGYTAACAADGREASRAMAERPFDVVVTDLLMPEKDGLELIEELRRRYPSVRIVAMSGGGRIAAEEYLQIARGLGANHLLGKPFLPRQLLAAVDQALVV